MINLRRATIPILVSAMLCLPTKASAADQVDGFSNLPSGDTLQMRFTSEGCFHAYAYDLTFTRTPRSNVTVYEGCS